MRSFINLAESIGSITWDARSRHGDVPVWIDVDKFDQSWAQDELYVSPGGEGGMKRRYAGFGQGLATANEPVQMPEVGLGHRGEIVFTNGRHRYSWLRDHGAASIPVLVDPAQAEEITARFGTQRKITKISNLV